MTIRIVPRTRPSLPSIPISVSAASLTILALLAAQTLQQTNETGHHSIIQTPFSNMFITYVEIPSGEVGVRLFEATAKEEKVSVRSWMTLIASNSVESDEAVRHLSHILSSSTYDSIFFETVGVSWDTSDITPFQFAVINEPRLKLFAEAAPDKQAFSEKFQQCWETNSSSNKLYMYDGPMTVCAFDNLGGDARLVAPIPQQNVEEVVYSHLVPFLQKAPTNQVREFWRLGASQFIDKIKGGKTWLSTNGMGVAWLHLRLDSRPKYYTYAPFK